MRKIQNDNITFRVTNDLKSRLTEFCLDLREQMDVELPRLIVNRPADLGADHR